MSIFTRKTLLAITVVSLGAALASQVAVGSLVQADRAPGLKWSISGSQSLKWTYHAENRTQCEPVAYDGSGSADFKFKMNRNVKVRWSTPQGKGKAKLAETAPASATGSMHGTDVKTSLGPCLTFPIPQSPPVSADTSGCGSGAYSLKVGVYEVGSSIYVYAVPFDLAGKARNPLRPTGGCRTFTDNTRDDLTQHIEAQSPRCVTATPALSSSVDRTIPSTIGEKGASLITSKVKLSSSAIKKLKKRRSLTLNGKAKVSCTVPTYYAGGSVKLTGSLKYKLKFKR